MRCVSASGSNAIKIEGAAGQLDTIAHVVESGVPVMGHLGLTPSLLKVGRSQSAGSNRIHGRKIYRDAMTCRKQAALRWCWNASQNLGRQITRSLTSPPLASALSIDDQVLVLQDMLGKLSLNRSFCAIIWTAMPS